MRGLEVPEECATVEEMWWLLKEERREQSEIRWKAIQDEDKTTEFLLRWCIRHFGQASETHLASQTWKNMIDPREAENVLEEIVEGRF